MELEHFVKTCRPVMRLMDKEKLRSLRRSCAQATKLRTRDELTHSPLRHCANREMHE